MELRGGRDSTAIVDGFARLMGYKPPMPDRLECGPAAYDLVMRRYRRPSGLQGLSLIEEPAPLHAMGGVKIVRNSELWQHEWMLLAENGEVIIKGELL
jgi:hypothetical protein